MDAPFVIPAGTVAIPYIATGRSTLACQVPMQPSIYADTSVVGKASWQRAEPYVWEWTEALRPFACTGLHVCDNPAHRARASMALGQTCTATYDHTRTRDEIIMHKQGNWIQSPGPIGAASIRALRFNKTTELVTTVGVWGDLVNKLRTGMHYVAMLNIDHSIYDTVVSMSRCFEHVWLWPGRDCMFVCGWSRTLAPYEIGGDDVIPIVHICDDVIARVMNTRASVYARVCAIKQTMIHGVVDVHALAEWPCLDPPIKTLWDSIDRF